MIVERTHNQEFVKCFITLPEIFDSVSEDGQAPKDFSPDVNNDYWLVVSEGDEIIGLYFLHALNSVTLMIHAQILTRYRKEHSRAAGTEVYKWMTENLPFTYQKFVTSVPVIYQNVIKYVKYFGFKHEGTNRKSYLKGGEIIDMENYGITRDEVEEYLCQR